MPEIQDTKQSVEHPFQDVLDIAHDALEGLLEHHLNLIDNAKNAPPTAAEMAQVRGLLNDLGVVEYFKSELSEAVQYDPSTSVPRELQAALSGAGVGNVKQLHALKAKKAKEKAKAATRPVINVLPAR